MDKLDLKNGMKFVERDGNTFYIIDGFIYKKGTIPMDLIYVNTKRSYFDEFENDFSHQENIEQDIMEIYNSEGKSIYKRIETKAQELERGFENFCSKQWPCPNCLYHSTKVCQFSWLKDNYDIVEKKETSHHMTEEEINEEVDRLYKGLERG